MIREKDIPFNTRIIGLSDYHIIIFMNIKINGETRAFDAPLTVAALTQALRLNPTQVAVECNRAIVPRSLYGQTNLRDGDEIEIVHFIGGG